MLRRVVGWSIDASPTAALVTNALSMAISNRGEVTGTIIHSDQGVQYGSWAFTERARTSGLIPSMGSVGDCYDNGLMESFWSRMQVELLNRKKWRTRLDLANAMFEYIEVFHTDNAATPRSATSPRYSSKPGHPWPRNPATTTTSNPGQAKVSGHAGAVQFGLLPMS